ncbi:glycosyltransferase family 2 protein [Marinobacter sp. M216]|uniref:Glycosyltransferase family 2 protein n=1 Tax=Marinobacter albus TaxID=3030833 RepID=A0ABT7HA46_9GAMM|nr:MULTISPECIES: glycosyltransferase family 2 protein [unclassified Marinobacter]MBW7470486.1 glycosyltransferase family 2 protein [Marinobacter sp. F4218]MDK9557246.1 glycosyltransferase family 2 protein [Marinobacter sp. M216]
MKISIAMATYNGEEYLEAQLKSFLGQTRQPDELVVTDDCSPDKTESIIREFAKTAPFKVVFSRNEKNLGYGGNFNAALTKTTGDLVFLSDQDDVWFPEKIEHMAGIAERYPEALVVMNDAVLTDAELHEVGLTKIGQIRSAGYPMSSFVMGCCCAMRRELLDLCLPIPPGFKSHDGWLVRFADGLGARKVEDKALQYYRRHESNESQFLANSTKRISRSQAFFHAVSKALRKDACERAQDEVDQLTLFVLGTQRAQESASDKRRRQLQQLHRITESRIEVLKQRSRIRAKWFLPRAIAATGLFVRGGYRNSNGLKAMLRDLAG